MIVKIKCQDLNSLHAAIKFSWGVWVDFGKNIGEKFLMEEKLKKCESKEKDIEILTKE